MPVTGTYVLKPGSVTVNTGPASWNHGGTVWDANFNVPGGNGEYLLRFDIDTTAIVVDGGAPITQAALPGGFTPTSAVIHAKMQSSSNSDGQVDAYLQFGPILDESGANHVHTTSADFTFTHGAPVPSIINLIGNGLGVRMVISGFGNYGFLNDGNHASGPLRITGAYKIVAWWQLGDDYYEDDPGGGTLVDYPTPRIDSIVPNSGPVAGGTSVTITGAGFFDPDGTPGVESVLFDGEFPATSVVVFDQHTLTCDTPAHWKGGVDVVVVLDFAP